MIVPRRLDLMMTTTLAQTVGVSSKQRSASCLQELTDRRCRPGRKGQAPPPPLGVLTRPCGWLCAEVQIMPEREVLP